MFYEFGVWKRRELQQSDRENIKTILKEECPDFSKSKQLGDSREYPYETKDVVQMYLEFHYGPDHFGIENYPKHCARACIARAKELGIQGRVLDMGCNVGRSVMELASYFNQVVGLDYSNAAIEAAKHKL